MNVKRPPVVLDPRHPAAARSGPATTSKVAQGYKDGVAARAAAQRAAREPLPNLAEAQELYKPGKDRPMSIGAIGEAQRRMTEGGEPQPDRGLRPETVAGLQAIHAAMKEKYVNEPQPPAPPMPPTPPTAAPTMATTAPRPPMPPEQPVSTVDGRKVALRETLNELDDLEFDRVLRSIQNDAINNERERAAIKERVKPIDLIQGISSGEFTQDVPIIPDVLHIRYRSITALENQAVRLMLFKMIDEDKRRENISAELYGLMQVVCSVVRINNNAMPSHMKGEGYNAEFDEDGFNLKFKTFVRYPLVMLHAIGTHGYWFEQRVREVFSSVGGDLKNG